MGVMIAEQCKQQKVKEKVFFCHTFHDLMCKE